MPDHKFVLAVKTGDCLYAGTDANVKIILHDENDSVTEPLTLNNFFHNDFERGQLDIFNLPINKTSNIENVTKLEIFRDESGFGSAWFVEKITVENRSTGDEYTFPVFRWLRPHYHYTFKEHDTSLPQDDEQKEQRKLDLEENRKTYEIDMTDLEFPAMVKVLPTHEQFDSGYVWEVAKLSLGLRIKSKIQQLNTNAWKTIDDLKDIYRNGAFYEPKMQTTYWMEDWFFGYERMNGLVPNIIRLCTQIPEKLGVQNEDLTPFLEGKSVEEAIEEKSLFYCDLRVLDGIKVKSSDDTICAPIVLLYRDQKNQLLPIAIQLYQEPSPENPVFFPSDDTYTWLLAKMWYNAAETFYHEGVTHLGFTHLMMEGVCLALHRNVSVSHPIFKLLAPHFMNLLAINKLAIPASLAEIGWIEKTKPAGRNGYKELLMKGFKAWRMDVDGSLPEDLHDRGVYDKDVLPDYHYRDDALLLNEAIQKYVTDYVNHYYGTHSQLQEDEEMQAWTMEMTNSREDGGMELHGIPGSGKFSEIGQLVKTLTSIIFTCSGHHAAINFSMYDYYSFPPAYPVNLIGTPIADKHTRTEEDLVNFLEDVGRTFFTMFLKSTLSHKGTNSLGNYEVHYISHPEAKVLFEKFQEDLKAIGETIVSRNKERSFPYEYLHPENVANSISI